MPPKASFSTSTRGFTNLGFSPNFANQNTTQKFGGHRKARVDLKRVLGSRDSERSSPFRYQTLPWFIISKKEPTGEKHHLISDCRLINRHIPAIPFRLQHRQHIFLVLRKNQGRAEQISRTHTFIWGNITLSQLSLRIQVGDTLWEFQAACFELKILPQIWTSHMKVFDKLWRARGILCFDYLDDILVVNSSKTQLQE